MEQEGPNMEEMGLKAEGKKIYELTQEEWHILAGKMDESSKEREKLLVEKGIVKNSGEIELVVDGNRVMLDTDNWIARAVAK